MTGPLSPAEIDALPTWEERMSARAKARAWRPPPEPLESGPIHLHGCWVACPCGSEWGITTVALVEGYQPPEVCPLCGKPAADWADYRSARDVEEHDFACGHHPDAPRCGACGLPLAFGYGVAWYSSSDVRHFGGCPEGIRP